MRRLIKILLLAIPVLLFAGWALIYYLGHGGGRPIKKYVGERIQSVAAHYLNPKLSFESIDYQYPKTFTLLNMKLTDVDPLDSSKQIDVVRVDQLTLELEEIPKVGGPIKIQKLIFDRPTLHAVALEPGSGKFAGFSNFLKSKNAPAAPPPPSEPQPAQGASSNPPPPPPESKLGDIFQIRLLKLNDARIVYNPRLPNTEPMELDAINTEMNIAQAADSWYSFTTKVDRSPMFSLAVQGRLNLDHLSTEALDLKLSAVLGQDERKLLPPQLQSILNHYEARGTLELVIFGAVPLADPSAAKVECFAKMVDANVTLGNYCVPIDLLHLPVSVGQQRIKINEMTIRALDGDLKISGDCALVGPMTTNLELDIVDMMSEQCLTKSAKNDLPFAGRLNAHMNIKNLPLAGLVPNLSAPGNPTLLPESWGDATIQVDQGLLVKLPIIRKLDRTGNINFIATNNGKLSDSARIQLDFTRNQIRFKETRVVGSSFAARGEGTLWIDRRIDFKFQSGPIEQVQTSLGKEIGGTLSAVTDHIYNYHVTGSTGQPKFGVEVGGVAGQAVIGTVEAVGGGINEVGKGIGQGLDNVFNANKKPAEK